MVNEVEDESNDIGPKLQEWSRGASGRWGLGAVLVLGVLRLRFEKPMSKRRSSGASSSCGRALRSPSWASEFSRTFERVLWPSSTRAALFLGALWMLMCAQLLLGDFCMGRLGRAFEEPFLTLFSSTSVPIPRGVRNTTARHAMAERDAPSWVSAPPRRLRWRLRRAINQHPKEGRREGTRTHMEDVR